MLSMPCAARKFRCSCFYFRGVFERIAHIAVTMRVRYALDCAGGLFAYGSARRLYSQASFSQKTFREFSCFTRLLRASLFFFFAGFFALASFCRSGGFIASRCSAQKPHKKADYGDGHRRRYSAYRGDFLPTVIRPASRYLTATQLAISVKSASRTPPFTCVFCRRRESLSAECLAPSKPRAAVSPPQVAPGFSYLTFAADSDDFADDRKTVRSSV